MKTYEAPMCNIVKTDDGDIIRTSGEWAWDNTPTVGETPIVFMKD